MTSRTRRDFIRKIGVSAAITPFIANLPSLADSDKQVRRQRLIFMFSPNGTLPDKFWPDKSGSEFELKEILQPLAPFQDRMLTLEGISNKVRGDGDSHMRGMSCLLTGIELFPGNIQGGSHTPAGWASGLSIDQEIRNYYQSHDETRTRFGSLEFGVAVPNRADPWTRWIYAGPNKPVAPIDNPYMMFEKLYGKLQDQEHLRSILDDLTLELARVRKNIAQEDRHVLDEHVSIVRQMEFDMQAATQQRLVMPAPIFELGIKNVNDNIPTLSTMQIDLLVNSMANDMTRIASLQYTNSVGNARMKWLGIEEGHHSLSHDPDLKTESQEKLTKINVWFAGQLADLATKLDAIPEIDGSGTLLDNTTIIWTNELGKGNSHTLNNIPFVLLGNGLGFKMGRSLKFKNQPHNRLLMAMAHGVGHHVESFGNPRLCEGGALHDLV